MPKINRIRVTNIHYDSARKQIGDILIEPEGRDLLVVLANGGGKTLLLQLALQVILPNSTVKNRKIAELLADRGYTGHVLVEWLLDPPQEGCLLTGFCFANGTNDRPTRYFNYIHRYDEPNPLDIHSLKLVDEERKPINWSVLRNLLRAEANVRLQVFEQNQAYQEELQKYHIYPREWQQIRLTNGSEGGVDEFFRDSRTTLKLIENLLIPAVEDVLFQTDESKKELAETFHKHRQDLLRLPEIRRNLADFAAIRDEGRKVLDAVRVLDAADQALNRTRSSVARLWRGMQTEAGRLEAGLTGLRSKRETLQEQERDLAWRIAGHDWFAARLVRDEAARKVKTHREHVDLRTQALAREELRQRQLQALHLLNGIRGHEEEIARFKTRIAAQEQSVSERMTALYKARQRLDLVWGRHQQMENEHLRLLEEEIANLDSQITDCEKKRDGIWQEYGDLGSQVTLLENWIEETRQAAARVAEQYGPDAAGNPAGTVEAANQELKAAAAEQDQIRARLSIVEEEEKGLVENLRQLERDLEGNRRDREQGENDLKEFDRHAREIAARLARWEILSARPAEERERLTTRLHALREEKEGAHAHAIAQLHGLREKLALAGGRDHFLPHPQIDRVHRALTRNGVTAVTGAEWLRRYGENEEERARHLWHHPLLPYALVIEESDLNRGGKALEGLASAGELEPDFPVVLIARGEETLLAAEGGPGLNRLFVAGTYIYQDQGLTVFTSPQAFADWSDGLRQREAEALQVFENLRAEVRDLGDLEQNLLSFNDTYAADYEEKQRESLDHLAVRNQELDAAGNSLEKRQGELASEREGRNNRLTVLQKEDAELRQRIRHLEEYRVRFEQRPDKDGQLVTAQREREERWQQVERLRGEIGQLGEQRRERGDEKARREAAMTGEERRIRKLLAGVEAEQTQEAHPVQALGEAAAEVESLQESLHAEERQVEEWKRTILREQGYRDDKQTELGSLAIDADWLANNERPVTPSEMNEQAQRVKEAAQHHQDAQQKLHKQEKLLSHADGKIEQLETKIHDAFCRPPYDGYDPVRHEEEAGVFRQEHVQLQGRWQQVVEEIRQTKETIQALQRATTTLVEEWAEVERYAALHLDLTEDEADRPTSEDPEKTTRHVIREMRKQKDERDQARRRVDGEYQRYQRSLQESDNAKIRTFGKNLEEEAGAQRLYDRTYMDELFGRIEAAIAQYEKYEQESKEAIEQDRQVLVERMAGRASRMVEELKEIPRYSGIEIYGRELRMIRIILPEHEPDSVEEQMRRYIEELIEDLNHNQAEGKNEEALRRIIDQQLSARRLLNALIPLDRIQVRVIKPRKESTMQNQRVEYEPWDQVAAWSGGEEYSAYMGMFIVLISYLRQKISGLAQAWKVIVADNPFGKASSPHILETVFRMARRNRVQFIALTAHREQSILERFPKVYSLKLVEFYGKEIMIEQVETAFYAEEASGQTRFLI